MIEIYKFQMDSCFSRNDKVCIWVPASGVDSCFRRNKVLSHESRGKNDTFSHKTLKSEKNLRGCILLTRTLNICEN